MARRSNKTSHVLSLLTDPKSSETSTEPVNKATPPMDSSSVEHTESTEPVNTMEPTSELAEETAQTESKSKQSSATKQTVISAPSPLQTLVDNSQSLEERISQQIQASLSAQLEAEEAEDALRAERDRKIAERIAAETGMALPEMDTDAALEEPEEMTVEPCPAPVSSEPVPETKPEYDFELVNVMSAILDEFQTEFMEKLGMCTCHRCWLDTRALTLSSLNGKYVVLDRDSIEPMLNFYDHRYRGSIMAQLTKACMTVMANPHH